MKMVAHGNGVNNVWARGKFRLMTSSSRRRQSKREINIGGA